MKMRVILILVLLICSALAWGQSGEKFLNVQIDIADGKGYAPCEPSIAIHPKTQRKLWQPPY